MKDECYQFMKNQIGRTNIVGFGSYGQVKIAKNIQTNQIVAIKLIHGKNAKQQIDVHHKLNHPNIIKLLNYYYQKQKNITYMVLQFAGNGSLNQKIKFGLGQLSKEVIKKYFKNICQAVNYLHKNNYMHRDIKPQNVLITKDNIAKLCDFGFAAIFQARTTMCGTFQYMAPQMIKKKHYNYKIDIWALGILLFQMIQGIAPFRGQTGQQVLAQMKKTIKFSSRFDSLEIDLIKKILRVNAQNRPTIEQILNHPYFNTIKEQQKIIPRSTVQIQSKQQKAQQQVFIKDNITSSRQQLKRFLKNSNEKGTIKNETSFEIKKKSPFGYNYIKTQPALNDSNNNNNNSSHSSFRAKYLNNQQSQSKGQIFRKQTGNSYASGYSPQTDKKTKSPVTSKTQIKADNNQQNSFKTYKKPSINTNLFFNNLNSNTKTLNVNKTVKQQTQTKKSFNHPKIQNQKINNQLINNQLINPQFLNKSLKTIKPTNQITEQSSKTNLNTQFIENKPDQLMVNNGLNTVKKVFSGFTNVNSSLKYQKLTSLQYQNSNSPSNSYQQNYQARKYANKQTGFSYNQIYNLQKSANIVSPQSQSHLNKLKQTFK